jgi:hypothetical protein
MLPDDEYDDYIPRIEQMLSAGESEDQIASILLEFEVGMHSTTSSEHRLAIARDLRNLRS